MNTFRSSCFDARWFTGVHFDYAKDEFQAKKHYLSSGTAFLAHVLQDDTARGIDTIRQ